MRECQNTILALFLMVNAMNEEKMNETLSELAFALEASAGTFSLIFARCNYDGLRSQILEQLHKRAGIQIQEIQLPTWEKHLWRAISDAVQEDRPESLMVLGLESSKHSEDMLRGANRDREIFQEHFPFPLILWIDDDILQKLFRFAPDFKNWTGASVHFELPDDELFGTLQDHAAREFTGILNPHLQTTQDEDRQAHCRPNLSSPREFELFLKDVECRKADLSLELHADFQFIQGIHEQGDTDAALRFYEKSFEYWKQAGPPEAQGVFLKLMAQCHEKKGELKKAKSCLQECIIALEAHEEVAARCICDLCHVLKKLKDWNELEKTAKKALELNQTCGNNSECAECYLFLAETASHRKDWKTAEQLAQQLLDSLCPTEQRFLSQASEVLDQIKKTIKGSETTKKNEDTGFEPTFWSRFLTLLNAVYYEQGLYREAFQMKQERNSLEQQFGLRAFVGVGRLKPRRWASSGEINMAEEINASGRDEDIDKLVQKLNDPQCNVIVFHGHSGVGKSSILEAGLAPLLKQTRIGQSKIEGGPRKYIAIPVMVRNYKEWLETLGRELWDALAETSERFTDFNIQGQPDSPKSIIEELERIQKQNFMPVLIFDQFEEFFFVNPNPECRRGFYHFLRELVASRCAKFILSLREDYFHYLLECEGRVEFDIIARNLRVHLGNFSREHAKSVIKLLTERGNFPLKEDLINRIVKDLSEDSDGVRPIELQIIGSQVQDNKIKTLEEYENEDKPKEKLVEGFLNEVVHDCGQKNEKATWRILYLLTGEKNTRPLKTRDELLSELRNEDVEIEDEQLDLILDILVESMLVNLVRSEDHRWYQIVVHDYLVDFIREKEGGQLLKEEKDKRRKAEKDIIRIKKWQLIFGLAFAIVFILTLVFGIHQIKQENRAAKINATEAFMQSSRALFLSNEKLEAMTALVKAGLSSEDGSPAELKHRLIFAFHEVMAETSEKNILEGHEGAVNHLSLSPDGKLLASGSSDNTIRLWNLEDGKEIRKLTGHSDVIWSVSFSPNQSGLLASGSSDKTIRLWNLENGKEIRKLEGHSDAVRSIRFISNSNQRFPYQKEFRRHDPALEVLVSGGDDRSIRLWNVEDGETIGIFENKKKFCPVRILQFSPDAKIMALSDFRSTEFFSEYRIILWDVKKGREIKPSLKGSPTPVYSVSFSPDGKLLASGDTDGKIILWNVQRPYIIREFEEESEFGKEFSTFGEIYSVAFSPDGRTIASGDYKGSVRLWNVKDGRKIKEFEGA